MIKIIIVIIILLIVIVSILCYNAFTFKSQQLSIAAVPKLLINDDCIKRLSGAIQIETISYDETEKINYNAFDSLHNYLTESFPLIYSKLEKHSINKSLVFEWKGKDTSLKPAILMAHMDVVPANGEWQEAPFSGAIKDGFVWGRGTLDNKASLLAILEAVETLLQSDYKPTRTIYLAFGEDEETTGQKGAIAIVQWMKQRGIEAEYVLDEGMIIANGLVPGIESPVAIVGISEKGFLTLELSANTDGGHASMPANENAISILSKAIIQLQNNGFEFEVSEPVRQFWKFIGPEMSFTKKLIFSNLWLFKNILIKKFAKSNSGKAMLHTTIASTIFQSGVKENVIPSFAKVTLNIRTIPGKNNDTIITDLKNKINDDRINTQIIKSINASPVSDVCSNGFQLIQKSIKEIFPSVIVAPSLMIAGTDSKHYSPISKNIYRFLPLQLTQEDLKTLHGVNEKISTDGYKDMIRFYIQIIKNS